MIYIYNLFDNNKYFALPFTLISKCIETFYKNKKIECKIIKERVIFEKDDIVILFSGPSGGYGSLPEICNNKVIYINSESVISRPHIINDCKNDNLIQVLDYSKKNINTLKDIVKNKINYLPFTYHPLFESFYNDNCKTNNLNKEIDICMFGCLGPRREKIVDKLKQKKYKVWHGCCSNHKELFEILSKSKIILIIHYYDFDLPIDFYRLYLLLSNKIFTIHETPSDIEFDNSFKDKILFEDYNNVVLACEKYLKLNQDERDNISLDIYNWWKTEHHVDKYLNKLLAL